MLKRIKKLIKVYEERRKVSWAEWEGKFGAFSVSLPTVACLPIQPSFVIPAPTSTRIFLQTFSITQPFFWALPRRLSIIRWKLCFFDFDDLRTKIISSRLSTIRPLPSRLVRPVSNQVPNDPIYSPSSGGSFFTAELRHSSPRKIDLNSFIKRDFRFGKRSRRFNGIMRNH